MMSTRGLSLSAVAQAVGCRSRENCRCWLHGTKRPSFTSRQRLEAVFGIPQIAWDQSPHDRLDSPHQLHVQQCASMGRAITDSFQDRQSKSTYRMQTDSFQVEHSPSVRGTGTTLEACIALLADLRAYRTQVGLRPQDQLRYVACEMRVLALRARLERDFEMSEDRYVRQHPAWLRLQETILAVLRPHPEIMQAMLAALERAHPSGDSEASA